MNLILINDINFAFLSFLRSEFGSKTDGQDKNEMKKTSQCLLCLLLCHQHYHCQRHRHYHYHRQLIKLRPIQLQFQWHSITMRSIRWISIRRLQLQLLFQHKTEFQFENFHIQIDSNLRSKKEKMLKSDYKCKLHSN